jgi:hypothetical protein
LSEIINGDGYTTSKNKQIYLFPRNPKHYTFSFYTILLLVEVFPNDGINKIRIKKLEFDLAYPHDRTLLPLHDRGRNKEALL